LIAAKWTGRPALLKVVGDPAWEIFREMGIVQDDFLTFQGSRSSIRVEAVRLIQRLVVRGADRVLVPSQFLRNVVESWDVAGGKIDVVHNGVRSQTISSSRTREARRRLGHEEELIILSSGRLVPWKGFDTLVRIAAAMKRRRPELRWIIVGSGPWDSRLEKLAADLSVTDCVRFTGRVSRDEMSSYLCAADVFVLWSGYEGLSHVLLEAMHAGTPVVASDAGGNREVVEHDESGMLVPWGEPAELREAIERLCLDQGLRGRLSVGAKARSSAFSWHTTVERTVEILEQMIRSRSEA
jgi:glycosyltransferase involved in cell wall biosynthesis